MGLLKGSQDHAATASVLEVLGINMGQLALTLRTLGKSDDADAAVARCKSLLLSAKDLYASVGDELGATNAVFNLANQVRWHDGKSESLALVKSAMLVAKRHGDLLLLQKAKWLQHTLETGEIPDYAGGERRAWTGVESPKSSG
jgi:hypothetical protein